MAFCATTNENYHLFLVHLAIYDLSIVDIQQYISENFEMKLENTKTNDNLFQDNPRFNKFSKSMMHDEVFLHFKQIKYTIKYVWAM